MVSSRLMFHGLWRILDEDVDGKGRETAEEKFGDL